ncbi:hypothetical protein D3C76_1803820 [compost metagenome]
MDRLLPVLHLLLRCAHFACSLLRSLGHVLHRVSHLIDRCCYLVHLHRLLCAALLRGTGIVTDMPGGLRQ